MERLLFSYRYVSYQIHHANYIGLILISNTPLL